MQDLAAVIPGAIRINRGKASIDNLCEFAHAKQASTIIILGRWEGRVGNMQFYTRKGEIYEPTDTILYIKSCRLRKEFNPNSRSRGLINRSLAVISSADPLPDQATSLFASLLGVPKISREEAGKFNLLFSFEPFREDTFIARCLSSPALVEVGPSLTLCYMEKVAG